MESKPYESEAFNRLPLLTDAVKSFDALDGDALVATDFRGLFLRHGVDRMFGLTLLHRHFELEPDERLIDYGGTSVPWRLGKISRNIRPCNWALKDYAIRPYEFRYSCGPDAGLDFAEPKLQAFAIELRSLMHRLGAQGLFGLCDYPGDDFTGRVEVTEGRANINLKPEDYPDDMKSRTAAWFFSPQLWDKCNCGCKYEGSGHTGEHNGHRETT